MKRLLLFAACLCALSLNAQDLKVFKGDFEVNGNGYFDQAELGGGLRFGAFIADYVQIGIDLGYEDNDLYNRFSLGTYVTRVFETNTYFLPYIGLGVALGSLEPDVGEGNSGIDFSIFFGGKYFVADNVSLNTEVNVAYSSAETFIKDTEATETNYMLTIGLSYYW